MMPSGNQAAAWVSRGWCAPSEVLVRTICCFGAHQRVLCCAPFPISVVLKQSKVIGEILWGQPP